MRKIQNGKSLPCLAFICDKDTSKIFFGLKNINLQTYFANKRVWVCSHGEI